MNINKTIWISPEKAGSLFLEHFNHSSVLQLLCLLFYIKLTVFKLALITGITFLGYFSEHIIKGVINIPERSNLSNALVNVQFQYRVVLIR